MAEANEGAASAAPSSLETAAVDLAEAGYHVFRLKPRSKEPFTGSRGLLDATRNEREILGWWDRMPLSNIGVNCGLSDIAVLDIDSKAGADPNKVIPELEHHPCTRTGVAPERSEKYPDSLVGVRGAQVFVRGTMPTTNDLTVAGCEIKSIGGYVVSPPSLHPCGIAYAGALPPVSELPDDVARLRALVRTAVTGDVPPAGELPPAIGANRNVTLTSAAGTMRRRGMSEAEMLAALVVMNADRCRPPLEEREVRKIARSVGRYEPAEHTHACVSAGRVIFASQVKARPVEWLIPGRIPLGGVSLLAGDPKLGKSTLSCSYAAALSRDGHVTLFASAEDSFTRVIKPRLVAAGADLDRCAKFEVVDADGARNLDLPDDVGALAEQVAATGAALIVVDPLNAHLAGAIDSWKDHGIRRALAPLARLADEQGCAVLVVAHLNKTKGGRRTGHHENRPGAAPDRCRPVQSPVATGEVADGGRAARGPGERARAGNTSAARSLLVRLEGRDQRADAVARFAEMIEERRTQ